MLEKVYVTDVEVKNVGFRICHFEFKISDFRTVKIQLESAIFFKKLYFFSYIALITQNGHREMDETFKIVFSNQKYV